MRKEGLQDQGDKRMEQRNDSRIRPLMQKKNETEKRFQDQAEVRQKDSRIRGTKEWSREKIPGSSGQCGKKNKTKQIKQRKDSSISRRCVKRTPGSGGQKNGA
jgi:hypothetical protein